MGIRLTEIPVFVRNDEFPLVRVRHLESPVGKLGKIKKIRRISNSRSYNENKREIAEMRRNRPGEFRRLENPIELFQ